MIAQLASLVERLLPRLASAGVVLLLASVSSPITVGLYNWALLIYTACQALTDLPMRHVLLRALRTEAGVTFIQRYRIYAGGLGCAALTALVSTSSWQHGQGWWLLPIAAAPVAAAYGLPSVGLLQLEGRWRALALGQLCAAAVALSVSIPLLFGPIPLLGAALQLPLTEIMFAAWCRRMAARLPRPAGVGADRIARTYVSVASYSSLSWVQGQSDRLLIGSLGGTALLGAYSVGASLARSLGDTLASSTANFLRAEISRANVTDAKHVKVIAERILSRAVIVAGVGAVLSTAGAWVLSVYLLGPEWALSIAIVPILSLSALPAALGWSGTVLHVVAGSSRRALWSLTVGIAMAPLIAVFAVSNLSYAAWLVLLRELLVATSSFALAREYAPWRSYVFMVILLGVGVVGVLLIPDAYA